MARRSFVEWCHVSNDELEEMMRTCSGPDPRSVAGFDWDGWTNYRLSPWTKFRKGFMEKENGKVVGYNLRMVSNAINDYWHHMPEKEPFGFFEFYPARKDRKANLYMNATLINYNNGKNDIVSGSGKDYIVALDDPENPTILLGKMYFMLDDIVNNAIGRVISAASKLKTGIKKVDEMLPMLSFLKGQSFIDGRTHVMPNYFILKKAERISPAWQEKMIAEHFQE